MLKQGLNFDSQTTTPMKTKATWHGHKTTNLPYFQTVPTCPV